MGKEVSKRVQELESEFSRAGKRIRKQKVEFKLKGGGSVRFNGVITVEG